MSILTYENVKQLVKDNNKSSLSDEFVICLIWKESNFNESKKNTASSAIGLMQLTNGVMIEVNRAYNTSFTYEEMTDAAKNIQCGTYYLDLRIKWAKDKTKGIEGFGTGKGYANSIFVCEDCLTKDKEHWTAVLYKIHK